MTQRLKHGRELSARIEGYYGIYRTRLRLGQPSGGSCTCPSDAPCKHVRALRATWRANPRSFLDLDEFLQGLSNKSKDDLVGLIAEMAVAAPESLSACGFREFEPERTDDQVDGCGGSPR
jgi:uncharacterized Zn finger protein